IDNKASAACSTSMEPQTRAHQAGHLIQLTELGERLLVLGEVAGLRSCVDYLPANNTGLVDDEGASGGDTPLIIEETVRLRHATMRPEIGQQAELVVL